ncbi:hypothetical protein [Nonomuraea cavernae]|uniref:hypothetical protein n=1 Tax=Nonomuraea cavernae TaxID=2045107 RepID=UPI003405B8E2
MSAKATELRIHGVAGASPESVLFPDQVRPPREGVVGIYTPARPDPAEPPFFRREAYVWGTLTSGSPFRALWLLLLPFALANIAFYMTPRADQTGRPAKTVRLVVEAGHRLFALCLTGAVVLALVGVSMDVVGWQSARPDGGSTLTVIDWLMRAGSGDHAQRIALASLVPALALVVMWLIAQVTWRRTDRCSFERDKSRDDTDALPLARRRMWNGGHPVGRLRSIHVAAGFALIALALAAPFFPEFRVAALAVLVVAVVLTCVPHVATRYAPNAEPSWSRVLNLFCLALLLLGLALYVVVFAAALTAERPGPGASGLPGFPHLLVWLFGVQMAALTAVAAGTFFLARRAARENEPALAYGRVLGGFGGPVVLMLSWALAKAFSVGLAFTVAEVMGTPSYPGAAGGGIVLPMPYWWAAPAGLLALAAVAAVTVLLALRCRRVSAGLRDGVADPRDRRALTAATLTDSVDTVLVALAAVAFAAAATIGVVLAIGPTTVPPGPLVPVGVFLLIVFAVVLVLLGWRAYGNATLRRTVGVLWDVTTFWPRASHPLAPPCYAERVVPELVTYVEQLVAGPDDRVVISGHSQGSVIATVVVMQLDPARRPRVRLLTHGSPLCRLYARFFPGYFGPAALGALRDLMPNGRWSNLYRLTDPIGGPVLHRPGPGAPPGPEDLDQRLDDPVRGDADRVLRRHSDYYLDDAYAAALGRWAHPVTSSAGPGG